MVDHTKLIIRKCLLSPTYLLPVKVRRGAMASGARRKIFSSLIFIRGRGIRLIIGLVKESNIAPY